MLQGKVLCMLHCMLQCMSCVRSLFYEDTKSTGQYEWQQECPLSRTYKIGGGRLGWHREPPALPKHVSLVQEPQ